jgi:hypothetical protein
MNHNGFTALGKTFGTSKSIETDANYVTEHRNLKCLRIKLPITCTTIAATGLLAFGFLGVSPPNGEHDQLRESQIRRLIRRVQRRAGSQGGGRGRDRSENQVLSRLDTGHKDFFGEKFVNCRPFRSHHKDVRMELVLLIHQPPFLEGTRAEFEVTLDSCWYGCVLLLLRIRVKTDEKDRKDRSVPMDCDCVMIDCLFDYVPGCR